MFAAIVPALVAALGAYRAATANPPAEDQPGAPEETGSLEVESAAEVTSDG